MPRILNVPEVSPNVNQGAPYLNVQANPDSFGAGIGRALERGGEQSLRTGDVLAQNALRIQETTNEAAARDTFNQASESYRVKSMTDGIYSKKPGQLYGEGQTPVDVYKQAQKDYIEAGNEFAGNLNNPRAQLLFKKAWGEHGNTEMGRASNFAAAAHREYVADGIKAFWVGHDQSVGDLATNVEQNWRNLAGAEDAAATNLKVGLRMGAGPDEVAKEARKSADTLRGAAVRGWFKEQPDLDKAAEQLYLGKINNPEMQAVLDKIDPKQREALYTHLLESRHKLAVINNAKRVEDDRRQKQAADGAMQSIFLDPKLSTEERQAKLDALRGNVHIPIETLRKADEFIRDGGRLSAINVEADNLNVERAIRSDVIKTDSDLINYINGTAPDGSKHSALQISTEQVRERLLPMVTSKRDKAFTDIVDAGMQELGFDKSVAASGLQFDNDKTNKALKFSSDMTYYRLDHPDADFRSVARGMLDAAHKSANSSSEAVIPVLATQYRAALKSGNTQSIDNTKTALGAAMLKAGWVGAAQQASGNFDPLAIIEKRAESK